MPFLVKTKHKWCQPAVWDSACRVHVWMSFNPSAVSGKRLKRLHLVLPPNTTHADPALLVLIPLPHFCLQFATKQCKYDSCCGVLDMFACTMDGMSSGKTGHDPRQVHIEVWDGLKGGWDASRGWDLLVYTLVPCQQAHMTDTACLLRASCFKRRSSFRACSVWHFFFFF